MYLNALSLHACSSTTCSPASETPPPPLHGNSMCSTEFQKDVTWFCHFLPLTNGIFIVHADNRTPAHIYANSCSTGCGVVNSLSPCQLNSLPPSSRISSQLIQHLVFPPQKALSRTPLFNQQLPTSFSVSLHSPTVVVVYVSPILLLPLFLSYQQNLDSCTLYYKNVLSIFVPLGYSNQYFLGY